MIVNYYNKLKLKDKWNPKKGITHNIDIPFYAVIIGGSGSGKSAIVLDWIHRSSGTYSRICICCRSKEEPLYEHLSDKCPSIEFYENEIPDIDSFENKNNEQNLIVFDDLVLDKSLNNTTIQEYYIRGRKRNISCIYISQIFYKIPKGIRVNARYIILRKLSSLKDLKLILSEYSLDTDLTDITQLYHEYTKVFPNFMCIDTQNHDIRQNFQ